MNSPKTCVNINDIPFLFKMIRLVQALTWHQFLAVLLLCLETIWTWTCFAAPNSCTTELLRGFSAVPQSSISSFQRLLQDNTGNFSMGFLRMNRNQLALAVLHVNSSEPVWLANPTHLAAWSDSTQLLFNGSLMISDSHTGILWSTDTYGDRLVLLNNSNLQVQSDGEPLSVLWQSFDFPTSTLVENQNFTSNMSLISSNNLYALRLGSDFMGLYAEHKGRASEELYWKHTALEAKAHIIAGQGPIYARVNLDGYLGMYQTSSKPVDVQKFNSFQRPITSFLIIRIEPDGNLKGYYWDGSNWVLNYQAIAETCDLPSPCGSYGLCTPGESGCSCLDNRTSFRPGAGCFEEGYGDFCGQGIAVENYWVVRRKGVEPPHKELLGYATTSSVEQCESLCEKNCNCWGALYNNATGYCHIVDYPIQTMSGTGDEYKMGYFKVRKGVGEERHVGIGVLAGVVGGTVGLIGVIGFVSYMRWKRIEVKRIPEEDGPFSPGPYKHLRSGSSSSIEMGRSGLLSERE